MTGYTITRMLTARAMAAGLPADRITAHSLRYIRPIEALATTSGRDLEV